MASDLLNKIFRGEISAVHNYGAFVKIPGLGRTQGLVHKSQISSARVDDAADVLELNEKVWFKVISVSDDGKIGLSMKVVDQGNGCDLDPNNVQISLDAQARKERVGRGEATPITLDAVLKTTCSKCGVRGHLSRTCFKAPNSKTYDLLPEPESEKKIFGTIEDRLKRIASSQEISQQKAEEEGPTADHSQHSNYKHSSKKKKSRKRSSSSDSDQKPKKKRKLTGYSRHKSTKTREKKSRLSESSDSNESPKRKVKKHKKHKKQKRH